MTPGGYFGQALVVDAAAGTSTSLPLPDEISKAVQEFGGFTYAR